ncbi:probable lipoprotein Cj0396c [Campylobacter upsaliensis RM3195]|nr:probable lipoprotein Cj0396c [Campylobacter upsaliensis RM3195]
MYIFEKMGFLIKCDTKLENIEIFKLEGAIDKKSFMDGNKFYYDNRILDLDKVL